MKHALTPFFKPYHAPRGKRVYVSGPMTGYPLHNAPAFAEATAALREMGYAVCNPCETSEWLGVDELSHAEFLRFDFERVLEADFLVALEGWERSLGAISELLVATRIGTKVWYWPAFESYDRIRYEDVAEAISRLHSGETTSTTVLEQTTTAIREAYQRSALRSLEDEESAVMRSFN